MNRSASLYTPHRLDLGQPGGAEPALADREVSGALSLWLADAREQADLAAGLAPLLLDPAERQRAEAFRQDEDRRLYLLAHVALRMLLGARLGVEARRVPLGREPCLSCGGPHGRPVVEGAGTHFSLSHSGDLALIGLSGAPLGVDVERVPPPGVAEDLGASLHPAEAAELTALPARAKSEAFARTWARKEAYLKGIGAGLTRSTELDYVGTGSAPAEGPEGWAVHDVRVPAGYAAAMALSQP